METIYSSVSPSEMISPVLILCIDRHPNSLASDVVGVGADVCSSVGSSVCSAVVAAIGCSVGSGALTALSAPR